jgi:hypothetical protein
MARTVRNGSSGGLPNKSMQQIEMTSLSGCFSTLFWKPGAGRTPGSVPARSGNWLSCGCKKPWADSSTAQADASASGRDSFDTLFPIGNSQEIDSHRTPLSFLVGLVGNYPVFQGPVPVINPVIIWPSMADLPMARGRLVLTAKSKRV